MYLSLIRPHLKMQFNLVTASEVYNNTSITFIPLCSLVVYMSVWWKVLVCDESWLERNCERAEMTLDMICISVWFHPSHRSFRRLERYREDVYRRDQFLRVTHHTHTVHKQSLTVKGEENEEVFRNSFSWLYWRKICHRSTFIIRLWKQGWTVAINQMDGGIWWQRLNECKRHQSVSDYCNCHQIPPRPLTGHADPLSPPHTHISHHQHSSTLHTTGALEHPWTSADIHTLSTCPFTLAGNSSLLFFHLSEMSCTQKGLMGAFDCLIWRCFQPISTRNRSMFVDL